MGEGRIEFTQARTYGFTRHRTRQVANMFCGKSYRDFEHRVFPGSREEGCVYVHQVINATFGSGADICTSLWTWKLAF